MREFNSSVLIVGDRPPFETQIQMDHISRLAELSDRFNTEKSLQVQVLVMPLLMAVSDEGEKYLHLLLHLLPNLQLIIHTPRSGFLEELRALLNQRKIFRVLPSLQNPEFDQAILLALDASKQHLQDSQFEKIINENNEHFKTLYDELEVKVQRRQESLLESKHRAFQASARYQILLNLTELIQKSNSAAEIETILTQILAEPLSVLQTKIISTPQDLMYEQQIASQRIFAFFKASLTNEQEGKQTGSIFFRRNNELPFRSGEKDFLQKTAEIVSLALDRLDKLQQTIERKNVWDATFNALTDPVMIVNQSYEIIQTNLAFQKKAQHEVHFLYGKKCFEMLFARTSPCSQCNLGQNFRLDSLKKDQRVFDVYSEKLPLITEEKETYVHQYHDMTEQLKIEKKIMESASLAELGTIGSSIAHELNNPLGGMLSFAQLIQLELPKADPLYADISEIEAGVRRCRDIVQNLLGFARNPTLEEKTSLDLRDVIFRAVKIVELQSRAIGIDIQLIGMEKEVRFEGYLNHLTQALQNLLQRSIQAILEQMRLTKNYKGLIEIQLLSEKDLLQIKILDNSPGADNPKTLSLSIARQILHEHGASLEFQAQTRPFRMVIISFLRPVLQG